MERLYNPTVLFIASLYYCHFFVSKIPQGLLRVPFVLPLFYIFYTISWNFSSAFLRGISSFFITWILSFKILLFCFNQGPLSTPQNVTDFLMISVFPIKIKDTHKSKNGIFSLLRRYEAVELFKQPYKATSIAEFWGRRWNRLGSDMLRHTIYNPTRRMFSSLVSPRFAMVMAIINSFLVSAAMHELMFYYITCGAKPTFEVTKFFVLQGLFIALEAVFGVEGWDPFHPRVSLLLKRVVIVVSFIGWLVCLLLGVGEISAT